MIRTQRGRLVKKPTKYEPEKDIKFADDFNAEEYDSGDESDVSSTVEYSDPDDSDYDSDDSFVCGSDDEILYDENDDDDEEEEDFDSDNETDEEA